ncbi:MAG: aspartate carbamoyltransferase catalytic subunit [Candidatus Marinamargulisbacteria bacterium]|jgi:aspartate carbamoyltransferase catalytic subunit
MFCDRLSSLIKEPNWAPLYLILHYLVISFIVANSMEFFNNHIISVSQFDKPSLDQLFRLANQMKLLRKHRLASDPLNGYVLGNIFFEPSTRSRMSFASAFLYLGGKVNSTTGVVFSSISKGETLADTVKVIQLYCDVLVIRHSQLGAAKEAAKNCQIPLINAGDGPGEHPTQALLDLYTILEEKGHVDGLTISMVGDLRFGRTVHSLAKLMALYKNVKFIFGSPEVVQMPKGLVQDLIDKGFDITVTDNFDEAISDADVIYSTRIQKERFSDPREYETIDGMYVLTREKIEKICKPDVTILHPLPRTSEIAPNVDVLPNAAYFRQAENGLYVRMALFLLILGKEKAFQEKYEESLISA